MKQNLISALLMNVFLMLSILILCLWKIVIHDILLNIFFCLLVNEGFVDTHFG